MNSWNPSSYLQFEKERTQPAIDLAARVPLAKPRTILDLGCGPGNSTRVLQERWPGAMITGLDSSAEMLVQAKIELPELNWVQASFADFETTDTWDLVFSNAALQWAGNHEALLPRLFDLVSAGGIFAVQVPANQDSPFMKALGEVSRSSRWKAFAPDASRDVNYQSAAYYYSILSALTSQIDLWETTYYHVLPDHPALISWYRSTGLRPYLDGLPKEARKDFEAELLEACQVVYPLQKNGKVLFSFRRIFFLAVRA